jgi:hypothetical protein
VRVPEGQDLADGRLAFVQSQRRPALLCQCHRFGETLHHVHDASKYQQRWDRFYQACKDFFDDLSASGYYQLTQAEGTSPSVQQYRLAYRKGIIWKTPRRYSTPCA